MRQFQNKIKLKSRMYSPLSIILLILLSFLLVKSVIKIYFKEEESRKDRDIALHKLDELKNRQQELDSDINNLQSEEGIEQEIRSKFSVVKPGEQVIVVVPDQEASTTTEVKENFMQKVWGKFVGIFK